MIQRKNKISLERKIIYIVIILIIIMLILFQKEIDLVDSKYNEDLYDAVYQEFYEMVDYLSEYQKQGNDSSKRLGLDSQNDKLAENTNQEIEYNKVLAILEIKKIDLFCPIISETNYENLNVSPTKFYGCNVNEIGNFCIVGHNNRDGQHFNNLYKLELGDIISVTGRKSGTVQYEVSDKYVIEPNDLNCTSQLTNGNRMVTLITCTSNGKKRLVIQCKEVTDI